MNLAIARQNEIIEKYDEIIQKVKSEEKAEKRWEKKKETAAMHKKALKKQKEKKMKSLEQVLADPIGARENVRFLQKCIKIAEEKSRREGRVNKEAYMASVVVENGEFHEEITDLEHQVKCHYWNEEEARIQKWKATQRKRMALREADAVGDKEPKRAKYKRMEDKANKDIAQNLSKMRMLQKKKVDGGATNGPPSTKSINGVNGDGDNDDDDCDVECDVEECSPPLSKKRAIIRVRQDTLASHMAEYLGEATELIKMENALTEAKQHNGRLVVCAVFMTQEMVVRILKILGFDNHLEKHKQQMGRAAFTRFVTSQNQIRQALTLSCTKIHGPLQQLFQNCPIYNVTETRQVEKQIEPQKARVRVTTEQVTTTACVLTTKC